MRRGGLRRLRGAFLVVAVAVGVAVVASLRPRPEDPGPTPGATPLAQSSPGTQRLDQVQHEVLKGEQSGIQVEAGEWVGKEGEDARLKGARVSFGYVARGQRGRGTISAREATVDPAQPRAIFRGDVVLVTDDGFRLESDHLVYRGDKQLARTEGPARFRRKDFSGSSTGFLYDAASDRLELDADVHIVMRDPDVPGLDVRGDRGVYAREEGQLRVVGNVVVDRADGSRLTAGVLKLDLNDALQVFRAQFSEGFELRARGGGFLPGGGAGRAAGPRELRGRKLDLWFGENRALKQAIATQEAELVMEPAPGERPERRRLKAETLTLDFDASGQLAALAGLQGSSLALEPLARGAAPALITCRRFEAQISPETGEPTSAEFHRDVVFTRGSQRASGQRATFVAADDVLALRESPRLWDEVRGTELLARDIDVAPRGGDVAARGSVRHVYRQLEGGPAGLLGAPGEATVVTAQRFAWRARAQLAHYLEGATLRAGADLLEAEQIEIHQPEGGARRLVARGEVRSRMTPRGDGKGTAPPQVEGKAREMVYDERKREVVYNGQVSLLQGEIQVEGEQATLQMEAAGGGFERLEAGEPVRVRQGQRVADGARVVYTPADGKVLLTGPEVVLKDPDRTARGRSVTFHVGDDLILIDGREETRTETVFSGRTAPPPAPTPTRSP